MDRVNIRGNEQRKPKVATSNTPEKKKEVGAKSKAAEKITKTKERRVTAS